MSLLETGSTTSSRAGMAAMDTPMRPRTNRESRPPLPIPGEMLSSGETTMAAREPRGMIRTAEIPAVTGAVEMAVATGAAEMAAAIGVVVEEMAADGNRFSGNKAWIVS